MFVEHAARYRTAAIKPQQVMLILVAHHIDQPNDGFDGFLLSKVILKFDAAAAILFDQVRRVKPPLKQAFTCVGCTDVSAFTPLVNFAAKLRY